MDKLTFALKANAAFSALSGTILILFHKAIAHLFGVANAMPFWIIGIGLLFFSAAVYFEARKEPKRIQKVQFIIVQDILWVLGSALIIILQLFRLSSSGYLVVAVVAMIVAYFAYAQWRGIQEVKSLNISQV